MKYIKKNKLTAKNISFFCALCCMFAFSFPLQGHAEETLEQNSLQMPSAGGKLNLTPQKREDIAAERGEEKEALKQEKPTNTIQEEIQQEQQLKVPLPEENNKNIQTKRQDIILAPGHSQNSVITQEDGANVIIVHGSNKTPENYTNSTNVNNGFYMNITNPDGSSMNMGTYFNSNSNSNSPRKQSRAQIIVDKMD